MMLIDTTSFILLLLEFLMMNAKELPSQWVSDSMVPPLVEIAGLEKIILKEPPSKDVLHLTIQNACTSHKVIIYDKKIDHS